MFIKPWYPSGGGRPPCSTTVVPVRVVDLLLENIPHSYTTGRGTGAPLRDLLRGYAIKPVVPPNRQLALWVITAFYSGGFTGDARPSLFQKIIAF